MIFLSLFFVICGVVEHCQSFLVTHLHEVFDELVAAKFFFNLSTLTLDSSLISEFDATFCFRHLENLYLQFHFFFLNRGFEFKFEIVARDVILNIFLIEYIGKFFEVVQRIAGRK